jgi:hypothetical protein
MLGVKPAPGQESTEQLRQLLPQTANGLGSGRA